MSDVPRSPRPLRPPGLYDAPITEALRAELDALASVMDIHDQALTDDVAPELLARVLHDRLVHALHSIGGDKDKLTRQLQLANRVLELIVEIAPRAGAQLSDRVAPEARRLLALTPSAEKRLANAAPLTRPEVPLGTSQLLVNGRRDLSVGPEIRKELASADRVDLLCSFLKWSGFRLVEDALASLVERRGPGSLRVITTAYMGATEREAIDALAGLGAEVHVSYDTGRTRLHAKAWLFHRESGFTTACIGSSNLSAAAMLDGLEWNVRLSRIDNPAIVEKFQATFDQYWQDSDFESYDPQRDRERWDRTVRRQLHEHNRLLLQIRVEPRPHQREILESLASERRRGHTRNLVVAATGTGKTIVAALDYKAIRKQRGRASLLFVAHRSEILDQSLHAFRVVLQDGGFGERLAAGEVPRAGEHVFASVQSLHDDRLRELDPKAYDVVIVDEFHHAAAPTYDRLLGHVEPEILLGLTATPERADGKSVLGWFDGRVAAELRLWKALDQGLLCPFQYFAAGDGTDLTHVPWSGGKYHKARLTDIYTADHVWAKRVLQEVSKRVRDPHTMRALGFCVSIEHAHFMAERFCAAGLPAIAVHAGTPATERREALQRLAARDGALRVLFSVDLFNEGVDLPDVDTLLFLRPTESATVFLQQLGRGLRLSEDKDCVTVLDFIGNAHRKFRFDVRYRALVGGTRAQILRQVERGFPSLPAGCSIQLDATATGIVLDNIRRAVQAGSRGLADDLAGIGRDVTLAEFLEEAGVDLEDVYATPERTWTELRRRCGLPTAAPGPTEAKLARALSRLLHVDDPARLTAWRTLLTGDRPPAANLDDPHQRMLFVALGHMTRELGEMQVAWQELWACPALRSELLELLALLDNRSRALTERDPASPLELHASYTLDETMAAFRVLQKQRQAIQRPREGVYYIEERRTDLLFVTLHKAAADYSPSTMYDDYPISPRLFHWESQSSTRATDKAGRRYVASGTGGNLVLLLVRQRKKDSRGITSPYTYLGPVRYVKHESERPMRITWRLEAEMPAWLYQETKVAAG